MTGKRTQQSPIPEREIQNYRTKLQWLYPPRGVRQYAQRSGPCPSTLASSRAACPQVYQASTLVDRYDNENRPGSDLCAGSYPPGERKSSLISWPSFLGCYRRLRMYLNENQQEYVLFTPRLRLTLAVGGADFVLAFQKFRAACSAAIAGSISVAGAFAINNLLLRTHPAPCVPHDCSSACPRVTNTKPPLVLIRIWNCLIVKN